MPHVYFAAAGGRIKIGVTARCVEQRLTNISASLPEPLRLIGYIEGGRPIERALQERLEAYRLKGEWFRDCGEVRQILAELVSGGLDAIGLKPRPARDYERKVTLKPSDPQAFGRVIRLMWPDNPLAQMVAISGASEQECRCWLQGSKRAPFLVRGTIASLVTLFVNDQPVPDFTQEQTRSASA